MRYSPLLFIAFLACNEPPDGGAVTIDPAAPVTSDTLTVAISEDAVDPNKKDELTYEFAWSVDGVAVGDLVEEVPADRTAKGEVWSVSVTPTDGKESGAPFSADVTIGNSGPTLESVTLGPDVVDTVGTLTATYSATDPDGDELTPTYTWSVNGTTSVGSDTLSGATGFDAGDVVSVEVTVDDLDGGTATLSSNEVTVANTAPTAPVVAIIPDAPTALEDIVCAVTTPATDLDEDSLKYTVSWSVDGRTWAGAVATTTLAGDTIESANTSEGQVWTCEITANDGTADGPAGTATTPALTGSICGPDLHTDPDQVVDGWTLCYLTGTDPVGLRNAPCSDLVSHLREPVYGCWHGHSTYPHEDDNNTLDRACRDGIQHTTLYSSWSGDDHILTVCIQD